MRFAYASSVCLLVIVIWWAAPSMGAMLKQESRPEAFRCEGHFAPGATRAAITALFGPKQVVTREIFYGGDTKDVTFLFPDNPARRLYIEWRDPAKGQGIKYLSILGRSWSLGGVSLGMPLDEVERINGRPFKLTYFEGDFGGSVIDWGGGTLEKLPGGCRVGVRFGIDEKSVPDDALEPEVSSERTLLSSGPALRKAKPSVLELGIGY